MIEYFPPPPRRSCCDDCGPGELCDEGLGAETKGMTAARQSGLEYIDGIRDIIREIPFIATGRDLVYALQRTVIRSNDSPGLDAMGRAALGDARRIIANPSGAGIGLTLNYLPGNKHRENAIRLITRTLAAAAAAAGIRATKDQAMDEFLDDLANPWKPERWPWWAKAGVAIGAGLVIFNLMGRIGIARRS